MLRDELRDLIKGDIYEDKATLETYSRDASIFEVRPEIVIFPKDARDVEALVDFVTKHKKSAAKLSLTARSAGTDMGGGPLTDSIVLVFTRYFNRIKSVKNGEATAEPGVYYRDFEAETLKQNLILPSYPASRELCALGGIVANNSGGEKSLEYGKTEKYVKSLKAVLADGKEYIIEPLTEFELKKKMAEKTFLGAALKKIYKLIKDNYEIILKAKPEVSKNSSGYNLWDIWDKKSGIFDLTRLFVGSQGTLGLITEATFKLVPRKRYSRMAVIFLNDIKNLSNVINLVLEFKPESFEAYDDHTLKLAIKFFPSFAGQMGTKNIISLGWQFLPEALMVLKGGLPKLVLQVEFTSDNKIELDQKISALGQKLKPLNLRTRFTRDAEESRKYWAIRRESFNLLRHRIKDKHTAPFIDDVVVRPEKLPEFLPKLDEILSHYNFIYTLAGHVGDGNFHIIPLMNLHDLKQREIIPELAQKVYDLVLSFKGSISAEHNDGLIRSPYLREMYGDKIFKLFEETKKIFDPLNIFNPGKKVGSDVGYILSHIKKE